MSETRDAMAAANERTLKLVTTMQENMLEATKAYISSISDKTADDLTWSPPVPAERPGPNAERPDPKELIDETFEFQARMLAANKAFASSLAELWGQWESPTR
jgi:hypothetical protein